MLSGAVAQWWRLSTFCRNVTKLLNPWICFSNRCGSVATLTLMASDVKTWKVMQCLLSACATSMHGTGQHGHPRNWDRVAVLKNSKIHSFKGKNKKDEPEHIVGITGKYQGQRWPAG